MSLNSWTALYEGCTCSMLCNSSCNVFWSKLLCTCDDTRMSLAWGWRWYLHSRQILFRVDTAGTERSASDRDGRMTHRTPDSMTGWSANHSAREPYEHSYDWCSDYWSLRFLLHFWHIVGISAVPSVRMTVSASWILSAEMSGMRPIRPGITSE